MRKMRRVVVVQHWLQTAKADPMRSRPLGHGWTTCLDPTAMRGAKRTQRPRDQ